MDCGYWVFSLIRGQQPGNDESYQNVAIVSTPVDALEATAW
jgi:hypothetical protein